MMHWYRLIGALCVLSVAGGLLAGCSAKLNSRFDYSSSLHHHRRGNPSMALASFPDGEKGKFITAMERASLSILAGTPDVDGLARYAKKVDNAVRYKVSREIKGFFYLETPEGYYASEHEVIWMHLLLCWGYLQGGQQEKAGVEARKSANLMSTAWSDEGHFDDPLLRVIMGGLWAMLGQWDEARVDFRRAAMMRPSLTWAHTLARLDAPPRDLVIVLGGPGAEPSWNPRVTSNPIRGARGVEFIGQGRKSALSLKDDKDRALAMNITPDSSSWYRRHFVRNNEIGDLIKDSNYAVRMTSATVTAAAGVTLGIGIGAAIMAGGIGIGGGIVYLGFLGNSGELAALGIVIGVGGVTAGYKTGSDIIDDSMKSARTQMDISDAYRFVRFLPEYAWVGWSKEPLTYPLKGFVKNRNVAEVPKEGRGVTRINGVTLAYYPDVAD